MWYKQYFFEPSARVPLVFTRRAHRCAPRAALGVARRPAADADRRSPARMPNVARSDRRRALVPSLRGEEDRSRRVISEYTDMGVIAPCRMVRARALQVRLHARPPAQLFDLADDPLELVQPARRRDPWHGASRRCTRRLLDGWDADAVQRARAGEPAPAPVPEGSPAASPTVSRLELPGRRRDDSRRFVRASGAAGAKARARFPFVP